MSRGILGTSGQGRVRQGYVDPELGQSWDRAKMGLIQYAQRPTIGALNGPSSADVESHAGGGFGVAGQACGQQCRQSPTIFLYEREFPKYQVYPCACRATSYWENRVSNYTIRFDKCRLRLVRLLQP